MSVEIVRHIVDPQRGMEIMDVKDSHGREAQFQCGILPGNPEPSMFFQKCIDEFAEQENLLKEHIKKFVPKVLVALLLLFLAPLAYAAPTITVSASAVNILGTSQTISITVQLIDPLNTGMLKVSGTGIIPIMRASTVTPGTTATVGPIYGNDVILNGLGNANTTYYQVQVFTVTGGFISSTPALQNFYAFTGSGTIDLATATPLVPNFMNSTAGVSIPGNFSVSGTSALSGGGSLAGTFSGTPIWSGLHTFNAGITGTGTLGTLTAGTGLLGTVNTWTATQQFNGNALFNGSATFAAQLIPFQINFSETVAPSAQINTDTVYGDSSTHQLMSSYNNGSFLRVPQVIANGTSTMTSGAITAATCQAAITTAATGAATTDAIEWAYATAPTLTTDALLLISPYVTSGNVNFTRCNTTAGSITGTAIVINWRVIR